MYMLLMVWVIGIGEMWVVLMIRLRISVMMLFLRNSMMVFYSVFF